MLSKNSKSTLLSEHAALALTTLFVLTAAAGPVRAQAPSQQLPLLPAQTGCESCVGMGAPKQSDKTQPVSASGAGSDVAAAPSFKLLEVHFNGAQAVASVELQVIAQPYLGRDVSLADLEAIAQAVTAHYRARGYLLAQAIVPVQTVREGRVEISVVEGRVGKVEVNMDPQAPISEARVNGFLVRVQKGQVVNGADYERAMLLLSDQPGIRVGSALQEGAEVGTSDLTVDVNTARRWVFMAEADNYGTKEFGRYRAGGTVRWASPLGMGDNLDLRLMLSNGNAMQFGRIAYELPLGTDGWRIGTGLSRVNYELGGAFQALDAQGVADVLDVSLSYPLIRQRQQNLYLRLSADGKHLKDEYRALDFSARKRVQGVGIGWAWERRDDWFGGGYWASAGALYRGDLAIRDPDMRGADQAPGGLHTEGGFTKLTYQFSRLQAIFERHSLYVALGGQLANKNLDSSEKLALGGARAVRAYASGEVLVDQGLVGTIEWRWSATSELTPFVFFDAAHGRVLKNGSAFVAGDLSRSLRGTGLGLSWNRAADFSINATLAWRSGTRVPVTDGGKHGARLYVQVQKHF